MSNSASETSSAGPTRLTAERWIDAHASDLSSWCRRIWDLAEPAWREQRSAAWYVEKLCEAGFEVEAGSGGMPTAFSARWTNGPAGAGPTLLAYVEYDAVPGRSQAAEAAPGPRPGSRASDPGHTDPHSALGIGVLGGVLATQQAMRAHGLPGTLRVTGEPAEKMQGSKVVHGLRGYYDEADAIVSVHPFYMLPLCNTVRWDTQSGAYASRVWTFRAKDAGTWGHAGSTASPIPASHAAARPPGANLALVTMYTLVKSTTDAMLPTTGGWSLNEAILGAGAATADNLPAPLSHLQWSWRTPDVEMSEAILAVLERHAEHAAAVAHCEVEGRWVSRTRPGITNHVLAEVAWRELERVGAPDWDADALAAAREVQAAAGVPPQDQPILDACRRIVDPREAERRMRDVLPAWQRNWTSDDYVEMSWYAPTVRIYIARPTLEHPDGGVYPEWVSTALGGIEATIRPTLIGFARVLSGTLVRLLEDPEQLAAAREEHDRRTHGEAWIDPLLPADFAPPLDLPWPAPAHDPSS